MVSHPSWVCGLKLKIIEFIERRTQVTPFVGVWIETLVFYLLLSLVLKVTPFVGVWIETTGRLRLCSGIIVTPFVGVWIETRRRL